VSATSRRKIGLAVGALVLVAAAPPHDAVRAARAVDDTDRDADSDAAGPTDASDPGTAKNRRGLRATYRIRAGDTLWNVAQSMRGRGGWPKLWAMNPDISNPHWIYPGQVVRLREGEGLVEDTEEDAEEESAPASPASSVTLGAEPRPLAGGRRGAAAPARRPSDVVPVRQVAFVDGGSLRSAGSITGSVEEKIMLATGDQAFVEFPAGSMPVPGSRFSIYDVDLEHPLRSPENDAVLGHVVHVFGEVVIDQATDRRIATGHLIGLTGPVERGYRVGPVIPQLRAVAPRPNKTQVAGRIVAAVDPSSLIANQMFVIVDRGRRQGVEIGNRFLVLRQGDGLKRMLESWDTTDPRFPPYAVAEIVAVDVGTETTVGWISRGSRELRVGDVADLRRGY
jgi:hypothetical protein